MTIRLGPKIGRNAPCPCGSGAKYKRCCLVLPDHSLSFDRAAAAPPDPHPRDLAPSVRPMGRSMMIAAALALAASTPRGKS